MSQNVAAPGFFGKVPARGDFLVRRMPSGFQDTWENWLSTLVVAARTDLGPAWPDAWLTAPLWHFSLGRDVVAPFGAAGVLVASVDRVGRFFPLSIIGAASPGSALRADDWARAIEGLALAALDDDFDPDRLDQSLRQLGPPPPTSATARACGIWRLPIENDWPAPPLDALTDAAWVPPGPGQSTWWCRGSERMVPVHLRTDGLPNGRLAAAMVTGAFDPADGGDAAFDPAALARKPVEAPLSDPVAASDCSEAERYGVVTDMLAMETIPGQDAAPVHAIHAVRVDPLGDDPIWRETSEGSAETGDSAGPAADAGETTERPSHADGAPAGDRAADDPLAFLLREDDPLADKPG